MAGYANSTAEKQAHRLLVNVGVQNAIESRAKADPAVWTREDRQRFWTAVARGEGHHAGAALKDRLKASELLGRSQADFVERVEHRGTVTLEQVLAASRDAGRHHA
jgi:phage terminase small subunit